MNFGELFVTLGIKGQGLGTLKDIARTIKELPIDAVTAIAGMAGITIELSKMAEEAFKTSVAFQAFANQTGLSWQELQKWQIVGEQANVSVETVSSSISQLERNLQEIRLGRGNIAPFQMLGINPQGLNAFQVIERLRKSIQGLNPAQATNLISQMGLSPDMMNVLRLSDRQFTEFANHIHGLNERQEQDLLKSKLQIVQLGQAFRYTVFGIISDFSEAVEKSKQFKHVLEAIGLVAAGLAVYFFPVTASVAALILVLDDLAVFLTGGKSLTGEGLKGFDKLIQRLTGNHDFSTIKELANVIHFLADGFERLEKASFAAGASMRDAFKEFLNLTPGGMIDAIRHGQLPESTSNSTSTTVNLHVQNDGALDAPGWSNVAHMIKSAVENAHLQLNN